MLREFERLEGGVCGRGEGGGHQLLQDQPDHVCVNRDEVPEGARAELLQGLRLLAAEVV